MSEQEMKGVEIAALLHDIGKLAVPEHILTKPGRLTAEEYDAVKMHPAIGANIIKAVPFPYPVASLIEHHHEHWNGRGYPQGLKGTDIPLGARILCIVDYFDALIADRPYHKAKTEDDALGEILAEGGKALDPHLVQRFAEIVRRMPAPDAAVDAQLRDSPASPPAATCRALPRENPRRTACSMRSRTSRGRIRRCARCTKWPRPWAHASASTTHSTCCSQG